MSIDLAGQNIILEDLGYNYEGKKYSTLFLHETSITLIYGPEDMTDKTCIAMSIDLAGQNLISNGLGYKYEGNTY